MAGAHQQQTRNNPTPASRSCRRVWRAALSASSRTKGARRLQQALKQSCNKQGIALMTSTPAHRHLCKVQRSQYSDSATWTLHGVGNGFFTLQVTIKLQLVHFLS